ncbi:hypothetical protein MVEN_01410600 [Mycena venus]|uniref:Uncharacterized protein n=1 Tax=Mycena venus TaxID=2733690 RepID=A0A8H6XVF1_9AGAR|nr:hypothetical protein MVEN_01410600 [Mycena venus]
MAPPAIGFLYQYIFGGVLALIALLGIALCLRAHRRGPPLRPAHTLGRDDDIDNDIENGKGPPPRLYDAYLALGGNGHGKKDSASALLWHDIMPISLHPVPVASCTPNAAKHSLVSLKVDADVPTSKSASSAALSAVALIVAMPSPPDSLRDPENDEPPSLPYLELGVADVELFR